MTLSISEGIETCENEDLLTESAMPRETRLLGRYILDDTVSEEIGASKGQIGDSVEMMGASASNSEDQTDTRSKNGQEKSKKRKMDVARNWTRNRRRLSLLTLITFSEEKGRNSCSIL